MLPSPVFALPKKAPMWTSRQQEHTPGSMWPCVYSVRNLSLREGEECVQGATPRVSMVEYAQWDSSCAQYAGSSWGKVDAKETASYSCSSHWHLVPERICGGPLACLAFHSLLEMLCLLQLGVKLPGNTVPKPYKGLLGQILLSVESTKPHSHVSPMEWKKKNWSGEHFLQKGCLCTGGWFLE